MSESTASERQGEKHERTPPAEKQERTPQVHDPVHRAAYRFERDGENLWVLTWMESGGHLPEHFHPSLEERWEALDGTARVKLNGTWRDLAPADGPVLVARNDRHELRNDGGRQVYLRAEVIPAGRLEEFLTETARAAQEGLYNARNLPRNLRGLLWAAELADRFRDETVMCSPPPALQRLLLPPIAGLARRRKQRG
jgi:quercetin dioxygenase-like cupin family protein